MTQLEKDISQWHRAIAPSHLEPWNKLGKLAEEIDELNQAMVAYYVTSCAKTRSAVIQEIADVAIVLAAMAGLMGLSLSHAMLRKFQDNERRTAGEGPPIKVLEPTLFGGE